MSTPDEARWIGAALMLGVTLYHLLRLLVGSFDRRRGRIDVELTHAAMGAAMTGMLVGTLAPATSRMLIILFAAPLSWFTIIGVHSYIWTGRARLGVPVQQVVNCAAMTYMLAVAAIHAGHGMASMPPAPLPSVPLTTVLAVATVAVAIPAVRRLRACPARADKGVLPSLSVGCQVAMSGTAVVMLVAM
jgi:hypothetical protein